MLLQGCLNVNLKSVLPNQTYYSLDSINIESKCHNTLANLAVNISVLSPFDGKDILIYNSNNEINVLESYKWIDLPKNMIRNAFIKAGLNHCLNIEQNPSVSQRFNTLKINVNELYVKKEEGQYQSHIYLYYELMAYDMSRIKRDFIVMNTRDSNPAIAMQNAMKQALEKIVSSVKMKQQ
ncbi:hypothetical protein CQA53_07980 [Helicobacter didelphidarum]|uniref:ABC-type transport auxiliary lipoprotein component domain-containing protein n=2 Tax=Helicobacter didelphidarum TaxID=2040648 RepID=A0A3D8IHM6_9HELI|nr:hypothetical protein CQA53_07980 [Helicobacter didelphidarum]